MKSLVKVRHTIYVSNVDCTVYWDNELSIFIVTSPLNFEKLNHSDYLEKVKSETRVVQANMREDH